MSVLFPRNLCTCVVEWDHKAAPHGVHNCAARSALLHDLKMQKAVAVLMLTSWLGCGHADVDDVVRGAGKGHIFEYAGAVCNAPCVGWARPSTSSCFALNGNRPMTRARAAEKLEHVEHVEVQGLSGTGIQSFHASVFTLY